tara:strand:- start:53 stop:196 length:144 start_codon:yes stop_codon:yes gene_type:complete
LDLDKKIIINEINSPCVSMVVNKSELINTVLNGAMDIAIENHNGNLL